MGSKKSTNQVKSTFFSGISIAGKINNSYLGYLIKIVKEYNNPIKSCVDSTGIVSDLQIPKVIVIGAESSGKSSLLENITKCPIFPRHINICTKLPIHFKLNTNPDMSFVCQLTYQNITTKIDKDLIQARVQEIMNSLTTDISFDEIIIELNDDTLPRFEFYDLPGIVAYPVELSAQTYQLCEKYVCQKDVIILCVIPATTPRITSYQPIGLIKKYKKEKDTIICLTMCDRVQEEYVEDLIIKRITKTTDEYNADEFAGTCAIMNRTHNDNVHLLDHDTIEYNWFKLNIIDNIPENYSKNIRYLIENNITIDKLINNLHLIYDNYIDTVWIPDTLISLNSDKDNINTRIELLGVKPELINKKKLKDFYKEYTLKYFIPKYKEILYDKYKTKEDICKYTDTTLDEEKKEEIKDEEDDEDDEDKDDEEDDIFKDEDDENDEEKEKSKEYDIVKYSELENKHIDNYILIINHTDNTILSYINKHIISFEKLTLEFNIKRFDDLTHKYVNTLCEFINSKINICLKSIESVIKWKFLLNDSKVIEDFLKIVLICIDRYTMTFFSGKNLEKIKFNNMIEFINLKESEEFIATRLDLNIKLEKAQQLIDNIHLNKHTNKI